MPDDVSRIASSRYPAHYGVRLSETVPRFSWGAAWAGAMIAIGLEIVFLLFGLFIGFGMYNRQAPNPWAGVPAWSTAWYLVTAGCSMFFGAWCASRLSGNPVREAGILHGLTTWGLATAATVAVAAVASWAVLREGINVLALEAIAGAPVGQVQVTGPAAQGTVNILLGLALRIWGGVLLGLITAIIGGWLGRPDAMIVEAQPGVTGPSRLAA